MNTGRRIVIPNAALVRLLLAQEGDPEIRLRFILLNLIIELPRTITLEEICRAIGVPVSTAHVWIRAWKKRGYHGLVRPTETGKPLGRPPALDKAALGALNRMLQRRDHWNIQEVRALIAKYWGVDLSASQVRRILREKLRLHYSKPYPLDNRRPADAEEQLENRLIETYNQLMDKGLKEEEIAIGFLDEASPQLTANTARVWHFGRAVINKNTAKLKANAIGFYAIRGHSICAFLNDSKQGSIAEFLKDIRAANTEYRAIIVIHDDFSSHRAASVRRTAKAIEIALVNLPPYSPDLNPIEFIWKSIKRIISEKSIPSLEALRTKIKAAWDELSPHCSFAKHWIELFVPSIITYETLCN